MSERLVIVSEGDQKIEVWKDPGETVDVQLDWSRILGADSVSASTWDVGDGISTGVLTGFTGQRAAIRISGGEDGMRVKLTNQITTALGVVLRKSLTVVIEDK